MQCLEKNTLDRINDRLDTVEQKISELEDIAIEATQNKIERKEKERKGKQKGNGREREMAMKEKGKEKKKEGTAVNVG